jgi:hypothetical protein
MGAPYGIAAKNGGQKIWDGVFIFCPPYFAIRPLPSCSSVAVLSPSDGTREVNGTVGMAVKDAG